MTKEDHDHLSKIAACCGLKSPGALATYLLESSLTGGFNPIMAAKTARVVQDKMAESKWPMSYGFSSFLGKAPLLPEPDFDAEQLEAIRSELVKEIKERRLKEQNEK